MKFLKHLFNFAIVAALVVGTGYVVGLADEYLLGGLFFSESVNGLQKATLLFVAAASVSTSFTPQWCPQYLIFETATVPTLLQIDRLGSTEQLSNLNGAGITAMNNFLKPSNPTSAGIWVIPIADGLIRGKNINITIANATANAFNVYGISRNLKGTRYLKSKLNQVIANSGQEFENFDALLMPGMGANDNLILTDQRGNADNYEVDSLEDMSSLDQSVLQPQINNLGGTYSRAVYTPTANRDVVMLKFVSNL